MENTPTGPHPRDTRKQNRPHPPETAPNLCSPHSLYLCLFCTKYAILTTNTNSAQHLHNKLPKYTTLIPIQKNTKTYSLSSLPTGTKRPYNLRAVPGKPDGFMLCRCPVPSPPGCPCCVCPGGGCFQMPLKIWSRFLKRKETAYPANAALSEEPATSSCCNQGRPSGFLPLLETAQI